MDNILHFLRKVPLFNSLTDHDISAIRAVCHEECYNTGAILFKEGELGDRLYIIMAGKIAIYKGNTDQQTYPLTLLESGEIFGEMALIDGVPRSATAIVEDDAKLLAVLQKDFCAFIQSGPGVSISIMRALSASLRKSNERYVEQLQKDKQRIEQANQALQQEIAEHRLVEAELKHYRDRLEKLVGERTSELSASNRRLKKEIEDRNRSEEKYRMLVENAGEAIFIIQDDKIKFANSETGLMSGRLAIALDQEPVINFIHPGDREIAESRLKMVEKGAASPQTFSLRLLNANHEMMWAEVNTAKISWEEKPAMLYFLRDITHHKKMEEEFYKAQRMEALGTLAGGIAHNFNNLLQVIQGNVSFVMMDKDHSHLYHEEMKGIAQSVESGANLTRQLLGFARAGQYLVKPSNINDIIDKTAEMFARMSKGVKIHKYFQKNIWTVEVDPGQVELVLLNLFINARQAMKECGDLYLATENVILTTSQAEAQNVFPGRYAKVAITDTGIGMEESVRVKVFEPFFTTKKEGEGTGLGLASAYGIIKRHGGFINVSSEKGHGTTFSIFFAASEKESIAPKPQEEDWVSGSETILLVDDEDMVVKIGELMLKEMGYQVLVARGGRMAIEKFQRNSKKIDMVILDIVMPDMDGKSVYERLKNIDPRIRILLSSGYGIDGTATMLLENGCDGFIQKPFNMSRLSREIRKILDYSLEKEKLFKNNGA